MTLLVRALFSVDSGLFMESEYGELFPCYVDLTEELQNQYRFVGQVIGRFIVAAIILGITAFFTPNFTISNWWALGIAAIVLSVMDYLIVKF